MRRLQNQLVLIYVFVCLGYVFLTLSFYFASFRPLAEQLRLEHANEIEFATDSTVALLDNILERHIALARQTASRSAIRSKQSDYLAGQVSLEAFQDFSFDKLEDARLANEELLAIRRYGPDGSLLLEVGDPRLDTVSSVCDTPAPGESTLAGTANLGEQPALVFCTSIDQPGGGQVGFDELFVNPASVQAILDRPQYHDLTTILFAIADQDQRLLFWPSPLATADRHDLLQHHLRTDEPLPRAHLLETRTLKEGGLSVHALVDEQAFYAHINNQLRRLLLVLVFWGAVILALTLVALRRLLHRTIQVQSLRQQVQRDAMTGLFNHAYLQQQLDLEILRSRRYGTGFSLLMLDIDHFKQVNDTHGHQVGDQVLKAVADLLERMARSADVVARYGGEEFAILMPETSPAGAMEMAERLRRAVADHDHSANEQLFAVTISIGVTSCGPKIPCPDSEGILKMADSALYASKRSGRNRVTQEVVDG